MVGWLSWLCIDVAVCGRSFWYTLRYMKRSIVFLAMIVALSVPVSVLAGDWMVQETGSMSSVRGVAFDGDALVAVGNTGNKMYSTNEGETWMLADKTASVWWYDLVLDETGAFVAVGESGSMNVSDDAGVTWSNVSIGSLEHLYAIDRNGSYGYIVGANAEVYYFVDSTNTWTNVDPGVTEHLYAVQDMGDGTAWVGGADGRLLLASQSGVSWANKGRVATGHIRGLHFFDGSEGFIVGDNGLFKSTDDGGVSWSTVEVDGLSGQDLYSIEAVGDLMVVAGETIILRSSDAGETWVADTYADSNYTFHAAVYASSSELWVAGTDFDVSSVVWRFDGTGPEAPSAVLVSGEDETLSGDLEFFWLAAEDAESEVDYYVVNLDGGEFIDVDGLSWSTTDLSEGSHLFSVFAVDTAGNEGDVAFLDFEVSAGEEDTSPSTGSGTTANEGEAAVSSLIKLACDEGTDANDPCKAVYYYADDGKRHAFPNEQVFFTWFDDFDSVVEVSREFMSSLTLGANVTYHPGTKMVKFVTVPTVYAVEAQGVLRAIASEDVAASMYGEDWNTKIDDISDAFFGNYTFGESIESAQDFWVGSVMMSVESLDENF